MQFAKKYHLFFRIHIRMHLKNKDGTVRLLADWWTATEQ